MAGFVYLTGVRFLLVSTVSTRDLNTAQPFLQYSRWVKRPVREVDCSRLLSIEIYYTWIFSYRPTNKNVLMGREALGETNKRRGQLQAEKKKESNALNPLKPKKLDTKN